jgi:hypothetical protein
LRGEAPGPGAILDRITTGLDSLTTFLSEQYLREYIPLGGSKIKFATGRPGCGKTHFSQVMLDQAKALGYLTAGFSARTVWLHDFREIYLNILEQCGIERVLRDCADQITRELGYDPAQIGEGQKLMDYLSERGEGDAISKGEIRNALRRFFTRNPMLDSCFAACCSLLTGDLLGHPTLEPASRDLILAFMNGDKSVRLAQLRALGLSPTSVTRYNARHLLRSLAEVVHLGGHPGLLIVIDDMEALLNRALPEIGSRNSKIVEGPHLLGVTGLSGSELKSNGKLIQLSIEVIMNQKDAAEVMAYLMREIRLLCEREGIELL